jgi:hypothetical protein
MIVVEGVKERSIRNQDVGFRRLVMGGEGRAWRGGDWKGRRAKGRSGANFHQSNRCKHYVISINNIHVE